jgi:hypothetical protein
MITSCVTLGNVSEMTRLLVSLSLLGNEKSTFEGAPAILLALIIIVSDHQMFCSCSAARELRFVSQTRYPHL